jgi:hypothetical protein
VSDATLPNEQPLGFVDAEPAEPVVSSDDTSAGVYDEDASASRSDRARRSGYHSRFVGIYVGLAVVAGIGVGALVASVMRGDTTQPKPAAAAQFTPSRTGELGAVELAESVQRKYRLPNGDELTGVVASRNTLQDGKGGFLRVRVQAVQPFDAAADPDTKYILPDHAIQYSLCGSGASCAIPGKTSIPRIWLLKRQGLELAVRTLQNDAKVDNVAVFLDPVATGDAEWQGVTMVFDRKELDHNEPTLLSQPFGTTVPGDAKRIKESQLKLSDLKTIDTLTRPYMYLYRYKVIGGGDALMQLQPTKR